LGNGYGVRRISARIEIYERHMNRAFLIVLGPAAVVAIGYVLVLKKIGLEPPYLKLLVIVAMLGVGFWWIGRQARKKA
jgi:hypothetical protein